MSTTPSADSAQVADLADPTPPLPSRRQLWLAALKPPMYSVAVIPVAVGSAAAWFKTGMYHGATLWTFLGAAIAIIAWLNLSNDVFDADTGIDRRKFHSIVNLTGNKPLIFWLANGFLALGIAGIIALCWWQQDLVVLGLVLLCCGLGYTYQGPPFRLGYQGLGEIICFICFGPLALSAAYYSQAKSFDFSTNLAAAILVGITTSLILLCSHFHQVEDDLAAGKRSPIVRLGTWRGAQVVTWSSLSVYVLTLVFVGTGLFPVWALLVGLSLPLAIQLSRHVCRYHDQPSQVSNSKFIAVRLHFVSGVLLTLGLVLAGWR
jgi:2-carboxy-1,4-naphthoquinone phytyltransferase